MSGQGLVSRSRAVATRSERGHGLRRELGHAPYYGGPDDDDQELGRGEHESIPDTVERDGRLYQVDRCRKCGAIAPRSDGVCHGPNRPLDAFGGDR